MVFYTSDGKKTFGPFSLEELKEKDLTVDSLVYSEKTNWVKAIDVPELADYFKDKALSTAPPPPPPPHLIGENLNQHNTSIKSVISFDMLQIKEKAWLVALLVFLVIGGFGINYYQGVKEAERLEAEIKAKELKAQEEEALAAEKQRIKEINAEIQKSENEIVSLQAELNSARRHQSKVSEFNPFRTPERGRKEKAAANRNVLKLKNKIKAEQDKIIELKSMLY